MGAGEPWYVTAFRSGYRELYPHRDLASARREAAWLVEHAVRGRVLDLCCGFGRHSAAFAELGVDVFGLDLSEELLREAWRDPATAPIAPRLVQGDARALPFRGRAFDAVTVLFSSFGYLGEEGDARMLAEIARVVVPGGLVVLDLMNPARVRARLVPESRTQRGEVLFVERRRLGPGGATVHKDVEARGHGGELRQWSEAVRLYEGAELEAALRRQGLSVAAVHGDFGATPFGPDAPRQLVLARRA
jgi:SAM-dependent methyltransferase